MSPHFRAFLAGLALAALVLLAGCGGKSPIPPAQGAVAPIVYTWTNPTTRTNGVAFNPATEMQGAEVAWSLTQGGPYTNTLPVPGVVTTASLALPASITCGTVYAVLTIVGKDATRSPPTNEVSKSLGACGPSAATNFTAA